MNERPASLRALVTSLPARAWGGASLFIISVLLALQMHLVAVRLQATIPFTSSWGTTLVPLWILHGLLGVPLLVSTIRAVFADQEPLQSDDERDEVFFAGVEHLIVLIFFSMTLGSEIMLVQRLDGTIARSLYAVAGPLYAGFSTVALYGGVLFWHNSQTTGAFDGY